MAATAAEPAAAAACALARLEPIELALVRLEYVDADEYAVRQLLLAAHAGNAHQMRESLGLPTRPDSRALVLASCLGHLEVAHLLCDAGVDKDRAMQNDAATALMMASERGHLDVARLLCAAGADKDKAMPNGSTALHLASHKGHLEMVDLLCKAGADVDKAKVSGATALLVASQNGHVEVVRLLCEARADRDKTKMSGATACALLLEMAT